MHWWWVYYYFYVIVLGLLFDMILCVVMLFKQLMTVRLEVILQAYILAICPMLTSLPTHFCIVKSSCGVGGRSIIARVCSCSMSKWIIQVL